MRKQLLVLVVLLYLEGAFAVEFEPLNQAIAKSLGTTKASKKATKIGNTPVEVDYSAGGARMAFIEKGTYDPNCTHTWVVGVDGKSLKVTGIRVVEMSCPHAFPCKEASFLDAYKGKSPADIGKLDSQITNIAKATGSSELTTKAVKRSLTAAKSLKGKL